MQRTHFSWIKAHTPFLPAVTQPIVNVMGKGWEKNRLGQIPGVSKVIFEIRQPLRYAPIGFILMPKDFENRQFGVKSPHLVTLIDSRITAMEISLATSTVTLISESWFGVQFTRKDKLTHLPWWWELIDYYNSSINR